MKNPAPALRRLICALTSVAGFGALAQAPAGSLSETPAESSVKASAAERTALAAPSGTSQPAASRIGEPRIERLVAEDDGVRIEELRVRGQTQRIVVRPKGGAAAYEILPADGGRDMSEGPGSRRGGAGQRVWNVLTF